MNEHPPTIAAELRPLELRLRPDLAAFRAEVRAFLAVEMAPDRTRGHADPTDLTGLDLDFERAHQLRAGARGFLAISGPPAHGGGGKPPSWRAVYSFEAAYHDAPSIDTAMTLCGAPLTAFGSDEQRTRFLPPMARGEVQWCIAYTERGAGSDLGALAASATPAAAGGFVLDGHKVLVTGGHKADWCLTIARTHATAPVRDALSMFIVDLHAPGVSQRRRSTANGWTLSEITFDSVMLPRDALLGTQGGGWRQVAAALVEERSSMAHLGWATRRLEELATWARAAGRDDAADRIVPLMADLAAGYRFAERVMARQDVDDPANVEAAMAKVWATELLQRIARAGAELVGPDAVEWAPLFSDAPPDVPLAGRLAWERIERIHPTISVGANELQRDAIARSVLGRRATR